jgi:hypothetical protein
MNSPTPFSSSDDPTDFSENDDTESQPKREGLPAGFRMRASAHYVDQLETPPRPSLRNVAVAAIETDSLPDAPEHLVNSIRAHGVLEPLLVQADPRGRQYRLIAGGRRLAGARAAGLREVPCVVHTISDAEAAEWRKATRDVERHDSPAAEAPASASGWMYPAQREVESALATIESCAPLLNLSAAAARRGAAQVITGECRRAQRIVKALKALGDGAPLRRSSLRPADLFSRLHDGFRDEQRLVGSEVNIQIVADPALVFYGDDDLLLTAMASALAALSAAAGDRPGTPAGTAARAIALTATSGAHGTMALELTDRSLVLSEAFIRTAFTATWPVPDGDTVLMLLQAARRIAVAHGGSLALVSDARGTTARFQLPAEIASRSADRHTN